MYYCIPLYLQLQCILNVRHVSVVSALLPYMFCAKDKFPFYVCQLMGNKTIVIVIVIVTVIVIVICMQWTFWARLFKSDGRPLPFPTPLYSRRSMGRR